MSVTQELYEIRRLILVINELYERDAPRIGDMEHCRLDVDRYTIDNARVQNNLKSKSEIAIATFLRNIQILRIYDNILDLFAKIDIFWEAEAVDNQFSDHYIYTRVMTVNALVPVIDHLLSVYENVDTDLAKFL